jgi:regulator of cell morphogenesis and NO signaling
MNATIDPSTTLADLVTQRPELAAELERRSLDYCCGGHRTLADACARRGLDPDELVVELASISPGQPAPENWASFSVVELVDHLETTHHAYLHEELPRLDFLAARVLGAHRDRHPELVDVERTFHALRADLEPHLAKEERVLFPMIRELAAATASSPCGQVPAFHCGTLRNPISVMMAEHDVAGSLLLELRACAGGYEVPDDACASYRALYVGIQELEADTHLHIHKENNLLFPAVVALEDRRRG